MLLDSDLSQEVIKYTANNINQPLPSTAPYTIFKHQRDKGKTSSKKKYHKSLRFAR